MRFGWTWERWSVGNVQNGTYALYLFGIRVLRLPTIYLGTWWDDHTGKEPE